MGDYEVKRFEGRRFVREKPTKNVLFYVFLRQRAFAQNVKVRPGIPYIGQYTNLFIFQFVFLHCLAVLTTFNTLVNILWIILVNILSTSYLDTTVYLFFRAAS